ncbi:MAG TPA: SCO family protein [Flavipsychrobacter sp.]|nr:SCO family protein [Flavipsychrobacter sp.]
MGIAVAVLLPLSFYLIAKGLKKDRIIMPGYFISEKITSKMLDGKMQQDTIFHRIADLQLINQMGEQISLNNTLQGKILVINFIYTTCPSVCPKLTQNMKLLQKAFRKDRKKKMDMNNEIHLVSITVDPDRDSFQTLRKYAERFEVNHDHWYFLTGNRDSIYHFARKELGLSVQPEEHGAKDFIHTQKIVLVDRNRYIRGYYNGLDSAAVGKCAYDISLLSMEKKKKK